MGLSLQDKDINHYRGEGTFFKRVRGFTDEDRKKVKEVGYDSKVRVPICPQHETELILSPSFFYDNTYELYHRMECMEDGCTYAFYLGCCQR